ncbi:tripartite motif-containing protein 2-like [Mizuhopecten yessoensis]|uniref:Tripartite motif-containing protein 2 n=1 Tax=Mizuhopecten yessoensis TaxID=6573 RepID=A0A210QX32_MIZYE|nr:tripartite motif-containing protein 2-like [Mizuhopecten yessoensis]OWF53263.1 Tripartite motif-containing protein 2 [Mizuhopecten yessoensis]
MAEGGTCSDPPSVTSTRPNLLESHHLDCPICLEQLRQPRSLPCLHSLCEECLSSYIIVETSGTSDTTTSFTCPVCRTLTHPIDKSEDKENWAKQFPTDSHAVETIQLVNQTKEPYHCKPCQKKGNMTPAKFLCNTTESFFCESCKVDFHDMVHTGCDIVDIKRSNMSQLRVTLDHSTRRCDKHNDKMDCYCQDHKTLGCSKCIYVDHRKCEDVSTIKNYCEKLESTSRLNEMRKSLKRGADAMEILIKAFYMHLQSLTDDKDAALTSIDNLHKQIDKCVLQMKKEITDDLITAYKKEKENLKIASQKCERLKTAMENTLEASSTAQQNIDHMNTVLLYQRSQMEVDSCEGLLAETKKSYSTSRIEHIKDSNVSSISSALSLGKIVVEQQKKNVPASIRTLSKPLFRCEIKEIGKVNIKCPSDTSNCSAVGVVYFPDGRIVVGDYTNKKIKLITDDGNVAAELQVNGTPGDVCIVDNTTVAVAVMRPGGIRVVTVAPSKLTMSSQINTEIPCYSIACRNGEFVVNTGSEVCSVSKDGTTHKLQRYSDIVFGISYDSQHGHLFITHWTDTTGEMVVTRLSDDNKHTDVLEVGVVKRASDVDVDEDGNVYVCGHDSNNVVQMSGDGTNVRELLTAANGIERPRAISVCGDKIVVTNTSRQMDFVRVFRLV